MLPCLALSRLRHPTSCRCRCPALRRRLVCGCCCVGVISHDAPYCGLWVLPSWKLLVSSSLLLSSPQWCRRFRVKLGGKQVEALIPSDLQGLTEYEQKVLEALKPKLKAGIEKGIGFSHKQMVFSD
ncbi:uncharacterized protein LOC107470066 isoform X1 [Arachis duranensis]|uniref:Uncharacterized protein LOC107470066 isoform X1 n=1 Tax=Arachis duranensis TaxID=130453 RepID=A0A6P4C650_ARADU|nr:uncharacterized protein LOC107470066 isoform X1 [Arachis duranensis]